MKKLSIALLIVFVGSIVANDSLRASETSKNKKNNEKIKSNISRVQSDAIKIMIDKIDCSNDDIIEIEAKTAKMIDFSENAGHILIADPIIADIQLVSSKSLYLLGLKHGETTLRVDSKDGKTILNRTVRVTYNIERISSILKNMFPECDISVTNLESSIVLSGTVSSPKSASDIMETIGKMVGGESHIVNNMNVRTPTQVMLKVKIAKVSRDVSKGLGINWRTFSTGNSLSYALIGGASGGSIPVLATAGVTKAFIDNIPGDGKLTKPGASWIIDRRAGDNDGIGAVIDALAEEKLATVLAEPTLVALSGNTAKFTSGGEQPYTQAGSGSTAVQTTEFKEWGVILEFTPTVLADNRIRINVKPEVSSVVDNGKDKDPSLEKQSVDTTVELGSGQSLAIAGLLKKERNVSASELPGLSNIPILGSLFRSSNNKMHETELVIIVTPYIVKPSSKELANPLDRMPKMFSPCESNLSKAFHAVKKECKNKEMYKEVSKKSGFTVS